MMEPMPKAKVDSIMIEVRLALSALCAANGTVALKDRTLVALKNSKIMLFNNP
jgi:hypothetical protein